ncbi:hypothetical protein VTK26DRAFT_1450 [Humicola hyalothermophila]
MHLSLFFATLGLISTPALAAKSPKRGLVSVPNENWPQDDEIWVRPDSPISWYWNFHWNVSAVYASLPQDDIEFVPMMYSGGSNDTHFLGNITALMKPAGGKGGRNITHIIGFHQPDQSFSEGGSQMTPAAAARAWVRNLLPLREEFGIKLGLPVVGDPRGGWLDPFLRNCSSLNGNEKCGFDFVPFVSFGNIGVLQDRIGKFSSAFPDVPLWVVEYGFPDQDEATTEGFFNESLSLLESTDAVERYSWFGSFRSIVSNVGPNQAMLDQSGNLTDIGYWYMGLNATSRESDSDETQGEGCTVENPCVDRENGGANLLVAQRTGLWWVASALSCLLPLF